MASQVLGKGAKMEAAAACLVEGLTISKATKVIWALRFANYKGCFILYGTAAPGFRPRLSAEG